MTEVYVILFVAAIYAIFHLVLLPMGLAEVLARRWRDMPVWLRSVLRGLLPTLSLAISRYWREVLDELDARLEEGTPADDALDALRDYTDNLGAKFNEALEDFE